jgi:type II secretory pathway predicted ATPase ExeA
MLANPIVILAGQPALRVVLSYNIHTPLRQRIALVHTMRGLAKEETSKYIESRLKMAGCTEPLFSESACAAIHSITNGWPRARKQHSHQLSALCCENKQRHIDEQAVYYAQGELHSLARGR